MWNSGTCCTPDDVIANGSDELTESCDAWTTTGSVTTSTSSWSSSSTTHTTDYSEKEERTVDDGTHYHTFSYQVVGTKLKMKFKSQPHSVDHSYKFDDLAWITPELKLTYAFGITNDQSLKGRIGGSAGTDWSKGIFSSDEWGEGFFSEYGFQRKSGWFTDSYLFDGASRSNTNLSMEAFYCTNSDKSCSIEFSRELTDYP